MQAFILIPKQARGQAGFTLIELMVAMVVGMVIVLALMTVTTNFEKSKRQAQGNAVMGQNVGFVGYDLDRQLRSAGSGYLGSALDPVAYVAPANAPDLTAYRRALGCTIHVARTDAGVTRQVLPMTATAPAPFAAVPQSVRLIPVLVHAGIGTGGSDVIAIMSGASGIGEMPIGVRTTGVSSTELNLVSTVGIKANDMLLLIENQKQCMMTQVASSYTSSTSKIVALGGTYYTSTIASNSLANFARDDLTSALLFGNATNNAPQMKLYGVGPNHMLQAYDLLQADSAGAAYTAAENVQDMRVLYGLDTNYSGTINSWVQPTAAGFTVAALTAGTEAAQANLLQIRAVRIAMLVHSDRIEAVKDGPASPATMKMFEDLGGALVRTISLSTADRQRHYKVVDFTIPLRNAQQLPHTYLTTNVPAVSVPPASQAVP